MGASALFLVRLKIGSNSDFEIKTEKKHKSKSLVKFGKAALLFYHLSRKGNGN